MIEDIYKEAIELWGKELQLFIFFEEAGELMQAISKLKRMELFEDNVEKYYSEVIWDELADMQIMLNQLKIIYGYSKEIEERKIKRLKHLIEHEKKFR